METYYWLLDSDGRQVICLNNNGSWITISGKRINGQPLDRVDIPKGIYPPILVTLNSGEILITLMDSMWIDRVYNYNTIDGDIRMVSFVYEFQTDRQFYTRDEFDNGESDLAYLYQILTTSIMSYPTWSVFIDNYVPKITIFTDRYMFYYRLNIPGGKKYVLSETGTMTNVLDTSIVIAGYLPVLPKLCYYSVTDTADTGMVCAVDPLTGIDIYRVLTTNRRHRWETIPLICPMSLIPDSSLRLDNDLLTQEISAYPECRSDIFEDYMTEVRNDDLHDNSNLFDLSSIRIMYQNPGSIIPFFYSRIKEEYLDIYNNPTVPKPGLAYIFHFSETLLYVNELGQLSNELSDGEIPQLVYYELKNLGRWIFSNLTNKDIIEEQLYILNQGHNHKYKLTVPVLKRLISSLYSISDSTLLGPFIDVSRLPWLEKILSQP